MLTVVIFIVMLSACGKAEQKDIIILFTNDVHCAIDENIGYAGLAAYKKSKEAKTPYVTLADCGDALAGDLIGTVSKGEYPAQIMKAVGYDFAVLGNREFNYGMKQTAELITAAGATYLGCNITYTGNGENALKAVKPYKIENYGDTAVAFIGVSTPESISQSTPSYFMDENGAFVYGFCGEGAGKALYDRVQKTVDECREKGADYVVVLSHLGIDGESAPYRSTDLIGSTSGIDVLLDGHSHNVIPCRVEKNLDGDDVLISSAGSGLVGIGQLVITAGGHISTGLITDYTEKDAETEGFIKGIKASYESDILKVVAHSDTALSAKDADGIRLVRTRETALGNFCADAYRAISGADIAFVNGGGIRADLPAGDITYADMIALNPYGNTLCVVKATGQEILDCLETASRFTENRVADNGNAAGECGGFQQVSGLKYTIDTAVPSSVKLDENGMFISVDGIYRVKDVMVQNSNGEYKPLDLNATYTLASHNYMIKECGDGFTMFSDNELIIDEGMLDYQIIIMYITENLGGNLGTLYSDTDGRITVK